MNTNEERTMSKEKHTPGPWSVGLTIGSPHTSPEGPWGWYQTDIEGPAGEGCFLELRQYHGGGVRDANARLIAAAPELLEALRGLVETSETRDRLAIEDALIHARAAIAKAEGR